ncbi:ATP-binding protein [Microtetraspora malaysiensis]|uniref:sensor histidine kinase n=1 Tax=Microtetraspora malaysiensis TaxID=161358 RepID=UPI003D8FD82D
MRWSVRLRATLVATVTVALALGVAAAVLVGILKSSLEAGVGRDASRRAEAAAQAIGMNADDTATMVSVPVYGSADPDVRVEARGAATPDGGWSDGYATASYVVSTVEGPVTVQGRASLEPVRDALNVLRNLLLVGIPALLLLVAGVSWLLVGRALAPVSAIRRTFADITTSDLHQRVPVPATGDEVARLARTMNATLDRLEGAVEQHKRFVADAAHELRSPIATLRTRLELGGREAPELTREALTDVERVQRLAADLLLLARLDAGEPLRTREVDLGQVATEEALRTRHGDIHIFLDIANDVVVEGSSSHLGRMIGNLVDNAVRHAATAVTVRVTAPATVEVVDDGPGIPAEHRESVFDRFTRLDEARARDAGGSGLGLAIAWDIAHAHGGTLVVADPGPAGTQGACLRADLRPLASRADEWTRLRPRPKAEEAAGPLSADHLRVRVEHGPS